jgi:DNA processing protein
VTEQARADLGRAARLGIHAIPYGDPGYPPLLETIADPPLVLWTRGQPAGLCRPAIALVGSRSATPYAIAIARQIAMDLSAAGLVVVSGLARGIDSAAHGAVVSAKGTTIGVLGCGIDRIYPPEHQPLALDMQRSGAIVSEFPPGVPPLRHHFPLRNRIISGLSMAVVVVEAPEKSGALITASAAADQGRDVMVVPGPASGRNRGGHLLLRDGARVVENADDILRELPAGGLRQIPLAAGPSLGQLPENIEFTVDDVSERTGDPPGVVLAHLLELELTGKIQRVGGGRFLRVLT